LLSKTDAEPEGEKLACTPQPAMSVRAQQSAAANQPSIGFR
jgi:hypothetical protein